jgi:hypothetical protein
MKTGISEASKRVYRSRGPWNKARAQARHTQR